MFCIHHYICAIAEGEFSRCECLKCGLVQYFRNCIEGEMWLHFRDEPYQYNEMLPYPSKPIMSL